MVPLPDVESRGIRPLKIPVFPSKIIIDRPIGIATLGQIGSISRVFYRSVIRKGNLLRASPLFTVLFCSDILIRLIDME